MKIAIASGKGGTGKTTVAVNLAWVLSGHGKAVRYLDCDVEEPNGHLFLKSKFDKTETAFIPVPAIDESKCDACDECVRFCRYKALVQLGKIVMVFEELCHGCGGCLRVCPKQAITEKEKRIGTVDTGYAGKIAFVSGRLDVGQAMSPPLIRQVLTHTKEDRINIVDAPPGTSCPVIAAIRKVDFVLLVTEPTPFGLHDLGLTLDMIGELGLPYAVVVNRAVPTVLSAREFCSQNKVDILADIPDDRRIAEAYSTGEIFCRGLPAYQDYFNTIWFGIERRLNL
ncbi:MAG: (4Fe-4S)-binding protein [Elusimicrobia bacterium RIFOXYB2_FULL_49_7]|nr:MAG: (4Fe-4S)-binding protein [Elusimicrobia bacterium RIFOXYB2_FULL_49_7]